MKENKYDDPAFFKQYRAMPRSVDGLAAAGEWHVFAGMMPDFSGKRVLDLGCGFGWHCRYARALGAESVVGVDLSENMLAEAARLTNDSGIRYQRASIEEYDYPSGAFDAVISSLALHYVESFADVAKKIARSLVDGGDLAFSVEHPIFTAQGPQEWWRDADGNRLHWPVDSYFLEGRREAVFLGEKVLKHHKTLTTYVSGLLAAGFTLTGLVEPEPPRDMLDRVPGMRDELRRPMMLLVTAKKNSTR